MSQLVRLGLSFGWVSIAATGLAAAAGGTAPVYLVPQEYQTIQAAVDAAEPGAEVRVAAGSYGPFAVQNKPLSIVGVDGAESTILDGGGDGPVVLVFADGADNATTVRGFTVTGGESENGGGVFLRGHVTLEDAVVSNNHATNGGGAFLIGEPLLRRVQMKDNVASSGGGAFAAASSTPRFESCTFKSNTAELGGGLMVPPEGFEPTAATVVDCVFTINDGVLGGALAAVNGSVNISGGSMSGNVSDIGGAVYAEDGASVAATGVEFRFNTAGEGAAVFAGINTVVAISSAQIVDNESAPNSGALHGAEGGEVHFGDSYLTDNTPADQFGETLDLGGNTFGAQPCSAADLGVPYGQIDLADVLAFLNFFQARDERVDMAAQYGRFDVADIIAFLQVYAAGCP